LPLKTSLTQGFARIEILAAGKFLLKDDIAAVVSTASPIQFTDLIRIPFYLSFLKIYHFFLIVNVQNIPLVISRHPPLIPSLVRGETEGLKGGWGDLGEIVRKGVLI